MPRTTATQLLAAEATEVCSKATTGEASEAESYGPRKVGYGPKVNMT